MAQKIKSVLLVDNCDITSHTNREILKRTKLVNSISIFNNAKKAINYLSKKLERGHEMPNIIMIGSKLKKISSWDFLENLRKIVPISSQVEVYVINSHDNVSNIIKNSFHPLTKSIINTPITDWEMKSILSNYSEKQQFGVA